MSIILNDQLIAGGGSGGGGGNGANLDLSNLSTAGNSRLQYTPFAINAGTVSNGENNTLYTNSEIQYFKRNVTETGSSITWNKSIVSGFSTSSYISTPNSFSPSSSTWEMIFKFTTGSSLSQHETIVGSLGISSYHDNVSLAIRDYVVYAVFSSSTTTQFGSITGTTTIVPNTTYIVKLEFDGSKYNLYLDDTLEGTLSSSSTVYSYKLSIGIQATTDGAAAYPFMGNIDLSSSYIKINNSIWWQGIIDGTSSDYDYLVGGGAEIYCNPCTITTCDGRTKVFDTATSIDISEQNDGDYSIFKDYVIGDLLLVDNFEISKTPTFINITSEGNAISSGVHSGYSVGNAFDGNISTKWGSSQQGTNVPNNAYIGRSGLTKPVKKVRLYQGYDSSGTNYCAEIKVQYSNDGTNWIDIDTITGGANLTWQEWILPNYTPSSSTHSFRLLASSSPAITTNSLWIVDELELYSTGTYSYWLDTSTTPANLKVNGVINNDLVYIGDCTILNGVITTLTNKEFNNSGYPINSFNTSASFPSDRYIVLTLGASGTSYTAPADGWYYINTYCSVDSSIELFNSGANIRIMYRSGTSGNHIIRGIIPARKGDVVYVNYNDTLNNPIFHFNYAAGSEGEVNQ